jgi:GDP-4-dehydro-6-deoxy-D-mannose reductase
LSPSAANKLLLTGISGFVGSRLCRELLERGYEVTGLVLPHEDLGKLEGVLDNIQIVDGNLADPSSLLRALDRSAAASVIHLAAESAPGRSYKAPVRFYQTNVLGTLNLLEAIRQSGKGRRFLLFSSAEVYGIVKPEELPLKETSPLKPANPYAASKAANHYHLIQYAMHFGLEMIEVRPFNMIGPGQDLGFVLPDFASQVAEIVAGKREPRMQVGRLTDMRDFLDIHDAVQAIADLVDKGQGGEVYHVCRGEPVAVERLLELLLKAVVIEIEITQDPERLRPARNPVIFGSNDKLTALTGWRPQTPLEKTVRDTLAFWIDKV